MMSNPVVHWEIGGHDAAALPDFCGKAFGRRAYRERACGDGRVLATARPRRGVLRPWTADRRRLMVLS